MFLPTMNREGSHYYGAWRTYINKTTNRKIFVAALTIGILASITRVVALVKEMLVAWRFGTGDMLEAFLIAFLIPSLLLNVIATSFKIVLIPIYIQVREHEGAASAQKLLSVVTFWSLVLLATAVLLIVLSAPYYLPWVASGFDEKKLNLTLQLTYIIAPAILFDGLSAIWGAVLNAGERFALAALAPVVTPTVTIVLLSLAGSWGIHALAFGLISGSLLELSLLGIGLKLRRYALRPRWYPPDQHLSNMINQFRPRLVANVVRNSSSVVDRSMAAMLPSGSVAALAYGDRLVSTLLGFVSFTLGTAITPYLSKMVAHNDWQGIRHTLRSYLSLVLLVSTPLTALLILFSGTIVRALYERGSFTAEDTNLVAFILVFYLLQIPFMIVAEIVSRLLAALLVTRVVMWGAIINLLLNVVLNTLFIRLYGVAGIALGTTCALIGTLCFTSFQAARILKARSAAANETKVSGVV